jgi:SAM-dependent methyltransferase
MTDKYVLPSSPAESGRLELQAALYGGTAFVQRFLDARPGRILDVGCGTGVFARHAAALLPDSSVVGLDADAARIAFARAHCAAPNARFEHGDLYTMPFPDDHFDLVYERFVLVHTLDPTRALREMARITRPGGVVVAYDMVHDGIWFSPEKPAFSELLRAAVSVMRERGMEPSQGLHLAPGMIRAGLVDVGVHVIPHASLASEPSFEAYRRNWADTVAGLGEILGGRFDAGLVQRAREELAQQRPDECLVEITVLAHGRKPAGTQG